jgi:outer membrane protein insertion porin family
MLRLFLCAIASVLVVAPQVWAEAISEISVEGNKRVEDSTVMSYLPFRSGDEYQPVKASRAVKTLYGTGLFSDVKLNLSGSKLVVNVVENPMVNKVAFEGNEKLADKRLSEIVKLRARAVFTPAKVQADVQEILAAYRARGRYVVEVEPQLIKREQNRVDVIYKISEGEKTKIRSIRFIGNSRFSDADLRTVVRTKESRFWRFLTTADSYDADRVEVDKELLRRFYIKAGHADFRVISAVTELSRDKKSFYITFTVDEGPIYDFGKVDLTLAAKEPDLKVDEIKEQITLKTGQRYDGARVDDNIGYIYDYLGSKGFAFLGVEPRFERNRDSRIVDVTFLVRPGPRVYVNRINIFGNNQTQERVIRREFRFAEGDAFSSEKLKRTKDRLTFLGYFQGVDMDQKDTEAQDKVDIDVKVVEQSTGEFNIGAGFSTFEGALATTQLREKNFLGRGQSLNLAFALSGKRQDFNFSFTEPYFRDQELSAGFDAFNTRRDFSDESSYDIASTGGAVRFGFPTGEFTRNSVKVGLKEVNIENIESGASQFVTAQEGKKSSLTLANTYSIDTRDSYLAPTKGYHAAFGVEYSGLGSDTDYLRTTVNASVHKELADDWVFSVGGRFGYTNDLGQELPLYEYFHMSGDDVRGFDRRGIGPRDRSTGDALGGTYLAGHNIELTFPIPGGKEMGISGVAFTDGAIITGFSEGDGANVIDNRVYRVSAGVGLNWNTPFGAPLRMEFGIPLIEAEEDKSKIFSISFGARF